MQGKMVLNAVQNAAKCKAKSINIHCKWYKQTPFGPLKTWLKRAKYPLKSGILGAKCRFLGVKKQRAWHQIERQNGAKCNWGS